MAQDLAFVRSSNDCVDARYLQLPETIELGGEQHVVCAADERRSTGNIGR